MRNCPQWINDLNILVDNSTRDWFVIEKPNSAKLKEIEKLFLKAELLTIQDLGSTGHPTKKLHYTQIPGCYIYFANEARYLSSNIRS